MGQMYKVVYRTRSGDLMSVWIRARTWHDWRSYGKKQVSKLLLKTYSTDKWTEASPTMLNRGYGLCVFEDQHRAESFRDRHSWIDRRRIHVWAVEVESTFAPPLNQLDLKPSVWGRFKETRGAFPAGTVMCKRARLIEKVS